MKEENNVDKNGCTSFKDILKAMDLDEHVHEHEYDIVLATDDDCSFNEEEEPIVGIKYMSTSYLHY